MNSEQALKLLGPYSKWQIRTYLIYAFGFSVPYAWMWMSIVFIGQMNSEQALKLLGPYSKWQIRTYLIYAFGFSVPYAWMWMSIVFIGDDPDHRCALSGNATLNESIPQTCDSDGSCQYEQCVMYSDPEVQNETQPCDNGYWYDPASGYESTLVTEFDLVCSNSGVVEFSMMLSSVGQALGALIFPYLSDRFGRKRIFLICLYSNIVIATLQAFSVNMIMYTCLSFLDGIQQQGMIGSSFILAVELFPTDQRTFAGMGVEFFWALGYVTMVPLAYFIRNWRYLQLAVTVPMILTIAFYWFIDESIPWLVANKKEKQAEAILRKAAKINGIELPKRIFTNGDVTLSRVSGGSVVKEDGPDDDKATMDPLLSGLNSVDKPEQEMGTNDMSPNPRGVTGFMSKLQSITTKTAPKPTDIPQYQPYDLITDKTMLINISVMGFIFFQAATSYYALSLTVTYLPGNRYINTLLYAILEVPGFVIIWILIHRYGRRIPIAGSNICAGVTLFLSIVPFFVSASLAFVIICNVIGKTAVVMAFAAVYVWVAELFPTNLRATSIGTCQFCARIGTIISPYFRMLARNAPWLPPLILGILCITAGLLALILPETRYEPLPNTIAEVRRFKRRLNKP